MITASAPDAWTLPGDPAHDLGRVLERWAASARKPERLHVLVDRAGRPGRGLDGVRPHRRVRYRVAVGGRPRDPADDARRVRLRPSASPCSRALAHSWIDQLAHSEYDVRGDVTELLPGLPAQPSSVA